MAKSLLSRIKHINVFFKDPDKKGVLRIIKEVIHFALVKKTVPTDYFRKFLYRKDIKDYNSYLSLKEYYSIIESPKLVFPEISVSLKNKLDFYLICKENNLPIPELFCHNVKDTFILNNLEFPISEIEELIIFFENLFTNLKIEELFVKPIEGIGGGGCIKLKKQSLKEQLNKNGKILLGGNFIYQENIKQHTEINKIHSKSINSIRIDTYLDKQNKCHILSATMRFGIGDSITDNLSSNGFHISVNLENGILQGCGRQNFSKGGAVFYCHPDSKVEFEGFKVPYFFEACQLAKNANAFFPNRIVGWDIAITDHGPIIIEGNHDPSLNMTDIAYGGYKKHPLINDMLNEIKS